ncbi:MAG: hypothetical protein IID08_05855 [Candidatus Hydrogenedentes bacterium]|nr:hypothetical protein [Candidatus Hydrogenedentota bacterium]
MKKSLTILGPGDTLRNGSPGIVLMDDQWYAQDLFTKYHERLELAPGVEPFQKGSRLGFRLTRERREELDQLNVAQAHVLFYVSNDTHVKTCAPIARRCQSFTFVVPAVADSGATPALIREGLPFEVCNRSMEALNRAELAVVGNDWGFEERLFLQYCRRRDIPTVCLQESTNVDFGPHPYRMQWADYVFAQGPYSLKYLSRKLYFLTGNPRYDDFEPSPPPASPMVLINSNFMYGHGTQWARAWIEEVVETVKAQGLPFRISAHPRDCADLTGLENVVPSSAYTIRDQIQNATLLISRFSSLPYEALLLNRHAVYYNPFGEPERHLNEDNSGLIHKCYSRAELDTCLKSLVVEPPLSERNGDIHTAYSDFFTRVDGRSSQRVLRALGLIARFRERYPANDARKESYLKARNKMFFIKTLRPPVQRLPWARSLWQTVKKVSTPGKT